MEERRGARSSTGGCGRTVGPNVGRSKRRTGGGARVHQRWPRHDRDGDLDPVSAGRTGAETQGMPSGVVLRYGLDANAVPVCAVLGVRLPVRGPMFVRGWTVVVIRMIVVGVRVQMPRRGRRHGQDEGLHEHGGDQAPHGGQSTTPRVLMASGRQREAGC